MDKVEATFIDYFGEIYHLVMGVYKGDSFDVMKAYAKKNKPSSAPKEAFKERRRS